MAFELEPGVLEAGLEAELLEAFETEVFVAVLFGLTHVKQAVFFPAFLTAGDFPTVKYLRIFSIRFGPIPRIARKSSTLLNAPYDLRICKIFAAVAGPIPGTCCNSAEVAEFRFTGRAGGFFFAGEAEATRQNTTSRSDNRAIFRHTIAAEYCI